MKAASASKRPNPFTPGFGIIPDHVVGRQEEIQLLEEYLQDIVENRQKDGLLPHTAPSPIVLTGPRGVGKTLLLGLLEREAKKMKAHPVRISQAADVAKGDMMARLVQAIAGDEGETILERFKGVNLTVEGTGVEIEFHRKALAGFKEIIKSKLADKSMVFLLDEVQHYQASYLGLILTTVQELINSNHPLLVVLAGTPDLSSHLMKTKTSFMVRSETIYINLLEDKEVRKGLKQPFDDRGIAVKEDALQKMQSLTDNYPYFVQTVGHAVWTTLRKEKKKRETVDLQLVEKARKRMDEKRDEFYSKIYQEMHDDKLRIHAQQVAEIIKLNGNQPISRAVLEEELERTSKNLLKPAADIVKSFQDRGFLCPGAKGYLSLGIPSFLSFLEKMSVDEAQQREDLKKARDKQQRMIEGMEEEPDLLDVTRYIRSGEAANSQNLRIEIPLGLGEEWNIAAERDKIYTVVLPNGEKGTYRVNRIEDHRENPYRDLSSFSGIILYLGGKIGEGFDNTGMADRLDVNSWNNKPTTRR